MKLGSKQAQKINVIAIVLVAILYGVSMWRTQNIPVEDSLISMAGTQVLFIVLVILLLMLLFSIAKNR